MSFPGRTGCARVTHRPGRHSQAGPWQRCGEGLLHLLTASLSYPAPPQARRHSPLTHTSPMEHAIPQKSLNPLSHELRGFNTGGTSKHSFTHSCIRHL